jgi:hypothetical protein
MSEHIVIGDIAPRVQYVANGAQTVFTYPFPIFAAADLKVFLGTVLQTTGYTVSGAGASGGGTVTFAAAPTNGARVTLQREITVARTSDFVEGGAFRAKTVNDELDRLTAMLQEQRDRALRALAAAPTDAGTGFVLPDQAARQGRVLAFDGAGAPAPSTQTLAAIEAGATNAAASATAAAASAGAAAASAASAAASFDSFDDRYLGPKAADPALDNDGDALVAGAIYFNTAANEWRVWSGAAWLAPVLSVPVSLANGGTGATTASGARTNLGLGTAALKNTGASGDAVPLLNQANLEFAAGDVNNTFTIGSDRDGVGEIASEIAFQSLNASAAKIKGVKLRVLNDAVGAGAESYSLGVLQRRAGAEAYRWWFGDGSFYAQGLADPGAGKINAVDYLKNGTAIKGVVAGVALVKNPIALGSITTQAHGLGVRPDLCLVELECVTAEHGWSVGDKIDLGNSLPWADSNNQRHHVLDWDATNVNLRIGVGGGSVLHIPHKTSLATQALAPANWKITVTPIRFL